MAPPPPRSQRQIQYLFFEVIESNLLHTFLPGGGEDMGHPGVLDTEYHPDGKHHGANSVHVKRFPLNPTGVLFAHNNGEEVENIYYGQTVVHSNGAVFQHGIDDGLHYGETEL